MRVALALRSTVADRGTLHTVRRMTGKRCAIVLAGAVALIPAGEAVAAGGMTLSPEVLEAPAREGRLGAVTIANTSSQAVTVSVTPRPWRQARSGRVTADARRTLLRWVRPSDRTFRLAPGTSRSVTLALVRVPQGGSLFGALSVRSAPVRSRRSSGGGTVSAQYELVGAIRATPLRPRLRLRVGTPSRDRRVALPVRNLGNTVDPVGGRYRLTGPTGTLTGDFRAVRILPGARVDLPVGRVAPGRYRLTGTLTQAGRTVARVNRSVVVR